jgi:hypothetical protein
VPKSFFNLAFDTKLTISNMERRHLSLDESNRTIGILEFGMSQADVVNTFNVRQSVILRLQQGYGDTETVPERRREGRLRVTYCQRRPFIGKRSLN